MNVNPTIVVAVLGLIGVVVSALFSSRVSKAKNKADTQGAFTDTVLKRLESVEDDAKEYREQYALLNNELLSVKEELLNVKTQNTTLIEDSHRQQRITEEMANYSLVLIKHIETGKPPPPPEVPWSLKPYFDTEAT